MTDTRAIIAELRELNNGPTPFATWPTDDINAVLDYIAKLEAVADAAEVVYAEWGEEEIACEFEEWRNLRSALDATDCDIKS